MQIRTMVGTCVPETLVSNPEYQSESVLGGKEGGGFSHEILHVGAAVASPTSEGQAKWRPPLFSNFKVL